MLRIEDLEIMQRLRKPGGDEFAGFCNKIIRAACSTGGVPQTMISASSRTDSKDQGVDTRVASPVAGNGSGYLDVPTIWQFKATDASSVSEADIEREVNKVRAKQLIEQNHGYRLCICDHLTDPRRQALTDALIASVKKINPGAPVPMVISVDDLAEFANSYPALVIEYRPHVGGGCILFEPWGEIVRNVTPAFVAQAGFKNMQAAVLSHVDFSVKVLSPVFTMYGLPGVGKTRTAFECLRDLPGAASIVLYTSNEDDVLLLVNELVNNRQARAIVVVDECSTSTRVQLSKTLMAFRDRIRCVCIDNDSERSRTETPELVIAKLASNELEKVLTENFKNIPHDRIRIYAQYCDGSVSLAADMCAHFDTEVAQAHTIGPVLAKIESYYRYRLESDVDRESVEAISLLRRVKYRGDSPTELDLVCDWIGITDRKNFDRALSKIKRNPGWIEQGALYYRVTPAIIAIVAFEAAWSQWARDDANDFLERMPAAIQESFMQRVSESGSPEVRKIVQTFFRRFADDFTAGNLVDIRMVNRFVNLVETDSAVYLPSLRRVVEAAKHEELVKGPKWTGDSWGPRRQVVWLVENFILFPEHFADCEAILFRLAENECEPNIGNNATRIWQQSFRLQMSGTSVPLVKRLELLRLRLDNAIERNAEFLSGAFSEILNLMSTRILGPPVVGGRIPPTDWFPADHTEMKEAVRIALVFLNDCTQHPIPAIAKQAKDVLLENLVALTRRGWAVELEPLVAGSHLDESDRASLATRLKQILTWGKDSENKLIGSEYASLIRDWIEILEPKSFHARLVGAVSGSSMERYGREKDWERELDELSAELLADRHTLDAELPWLRSREATSAFELGSRLGMLDTGASIVDAIMGQVSTTSIGVVRGYVSGLIYGVKVDPAIINSRLDTIEQKDPILSFQIALVGGNLLKAFERATKLIRDGILPAQNLRNFTFWVGNTRVSTQQVKEALQILIPIAGSDSFASDIIVEFLGARLHGGQFEAFAEGDRELLWEAISTAANNPGHDAFWLAQALKAAAPTNPALAIRLASEALVRDNYGFKDQAEDLLKSWVSTYPEQVMSSVGSIMLDSEKGWRFFASKFDVFDSIPSDVVIRWLESAGVDGARKLARHLPKPYIDASGSPQVPDLTRYVLSHFENDRIVFTEFCAGVHSFQMYVGDFAHQRESEAEKARFFFNDELRLVREWAHYEYESGVAEAKRHRERDDEMNA